MATHAILSPNGIHVLIYYALRIVCTDKILRFTNTSIIYLLLMHSCIYRLVPRMFRWRMLQQQQQRQRLTSCSLVRLLSRNSTPSTSSPTHTPPPITMKVPVREERSRPWSRVSAGQATLLSSHHFRFRFSSCLCFCNRRILEENGCIIRQKS